MSHYIQLTIHNSNNANSSVFYPTLQHHSNTNRTEREQKAIIHHRKSQKMEVAYAHYLNTARAKTAHRTRYPAEQ